MDPHLAARVFEGINLTDADRKAMRKAARKFFPDGFLIQEEPELQGAIWERWYWLCSHCNERTNGWRDRGRARSGIKAHLRILHKIKAVDATIEERPLKKREAIKSIAKQVVEQLDSLPRPCPNCGAKLQEKKPTQKWRRHFECSGPDGCTRAYHLTREKIEEDFEFDDSSRSTIARTVERLEMGIELR